MIGNQLKKILGFTKKESKKSESLPDDNFSLGKVEKSFKFLSIKFKEAVLESKVIMNKLKDLEKTNYDLGLTHLQNNNLREAIFRFKIVRKFWPENYEAHLNLIYCYFVLNEEENAERAIEYLLYLEPKYKSKIEKLRIKASLYVKETNNAPNDAVKKG